MGLGVLTFTGMTVLARAQRGPDEPLRYRTLDKMIKHFAAEAREKQAPEAPDPEPAVD